jgi:activator of 2-hydroxyglutaryl-CoA dehydratase
MFRLTRQFSPAPCIAQGIRMSTSQKLIIGVDVGSTTVKLCVVHPDTLEILWSKYERHETRQPEKTLEMLELIKAHFPEVKDKDFRLFITGSGGGPIAASAA